MDYMRHRSYQMQKHEYNITYPRVIFVNSVPVPLEHEKYCVDISWPGLTGMHYVTRRSHRIQKHKFGITRLGALFVSSVLVQPEHKK
jgi:hypothetical protein